MLRSACFVRFLSRRALAVLGGVVAVLLATACTTDQGGTPPGATADSATACTPTKPAPAAGPHTIRFGTTDRAYTLALPAGYDGHRAHPLLLNFHGFGGSMTDQEANTPMARSGTAREYIVVTPQAAGSPAKWNILAQQGDADDYGLLQVLLTDLTTRLCVDRDRVYATGHSNGSAFAGFLVCKPPYPFAAVAMVSGVAPASCPDGGPAPATLAINGTADETVSYQGSASFIADYVKDYHCATTPDRTSPADGIDQLRYRDCVHGTEVVFITVVGGTHAWPGGPATGGDRPSAHGISQAGRTFPATTTILDFFDHHRLVATPSTTAATPTAER